MKIHLHIDRLILDGLPEAGVSEADLRSEVAAELSSLLTAAPLSPALRSSAYRAAAAPADLSGGRGPRPQTLGRQIGLAVFRGVSR